VSVEFLDGTLIQGVTDQDVLDRWRRLAAFTDATAEEDPDAWLVKILDRCRVFYGAALIGIDATTPPAAILDALWAEACLAGLARQ
jgi:hypothetical protein